ncbi:hypothetical protein ADUPG1_000652 [Aduncisulcus paluster]|uniref:Uncharacterized protein n=1 Tax=Aduncisulcus paluster TaxID=2918883 RepID=A0ABQ5K7A8_9EUKA|nr:hypothetical protein ADUPG1_000652 [Aduncisulcus paluster]
MILDKDESQSSHTEELHDIPEDIAIDPVSTMNNIECPPIETPLHTLTFEQIIPKLSIQEDFYEPLRQAVSARDRSVSPLARYEGMSFRDYRNESRRSPSKSNSCCSSNESSSTEIFPPQRPSSFVPTLDSIPETQDHFGFTSKFATARGPRRKTNESLLYHVPTISLDYEIATRKKKDGKESSQKPLKHSKVSRSSKHDPSSQSKKKRRSTTSHHEIPHIKGHDDLESENSIEKTRCERLDPHIDHPAFDHTGTQSSAISSAIKRNPSKKSASYRIKHVDWEIFSVKASSAPVSGRSRPYPVHSPRDSPYKHSSHSGSSRSNCVDRSSGECRAVISDEVVVSDDGGSFTEAFVSFWTKSPTSSSQSSLSHHSSRLRTSSGQLHLPESSDDATQVTSTSSVKITSSVGTHSKTGKGTDSPCPITEKKPENVVVYKDEPTILFTEIMNLPVSPRGRSSAHRADKAASIRRESHPVIPQLSIPLSDPYSSPSRRHSDSGSHLSPSSKSSKMEIPKKTRSFHSARSPKKSTQHDHVRSPRYISIEGTHHKGSVVHSARVPISTCTSLSSKTKKRKPSKNIV